MHDRVALLHLQRPLQLFLQLHFISSLQACAASGNVVQCASQPLLVFFHPHSFGDGSLGALITICACPAVTSLVSSPLDMLSKCRWQTLNCPPFLGEKLFPSLIHTLLEWSYSKITNRSSGPSHSWTVCGAGLAAKAQNAGVTSLYAFQVSHAVFLPLPPKKETVSHPVKAWNIDNAIH